LLLVVVTGWIVDVILAEVKHRKWNGMCGKVVSGKFDGENALTRSHERFTGESNPVEAYGCSMSYQFGAVVFFGKVCKNHLFQPSLSNPFERFDALLIREVSVCAPDPLFEIRWIVRITVEEVGIMVCFDDEIVTYGHMGAYSVGDRTGVGDESEPLLVGECYRKTVGIAGIVHDGEWFHTKRIYRDRTRGGNLTGVEAVPLTVTEGEKVLDNRWRRIHREIETVCSKRNPVDVIGVFVGHKKGYDAGRVNSCCSTGDGKATEGKPLIDEEKNIVVLDEECVSFRPAGEDVEPIPTHGR